LEIEGGIIHIDEEEGCKLKKEGKSTSNRKKKLQKDQETTI